jgi:glycosyltransferase involved in cell wall biosynthesis
MIYPNRIGIHAPYTWDESTQLGCTLADLAMRVGVGVSWLSYQSHEVGVHYRWDPLVLSSKRQSFEPWLSDCSQVIWFDVLREKLLYSRHCGKKNILVPLWHRLTPEHLSDLHLFDEILCPHEAVYKLLMAYAAGGPPTRNNMQVVPWDSGLPFVTHGRGTVGRRILVPIEAYTAQTIGPLLLSMLQMLLDFDEELQLTLSYSKSWSHSALSGLSGLLRQHPQRVRILKRPSWTDRLEAYHSHDCVFFPNLRENTGAMAIEAICCRRPVVAFDFSPFAEILTAGQDAVLIPCEIRRNWIGSPEAVVNAFDLAEQLRRVTESKLTCFRPDRDWSFKRWQVRREKFELAWRGLWDMLV